LRGTYSKVFWLRRVSDRKSAHPKHHKKIKTMTAQFARQDQRNWDEKWPAIMLTVNMTMSESTGYTPLFLTQGREPENRTPRRALARVIHDYAGGKDIIKDVAQGYDPGCASTIRYPLAKVCAKMMEICKQQIKIEITGRHLAMFTTFGHAGFSTSNRYN